MAKPSRKPGPRQSGETLDALLLALQKTLSRVNKASAKVPEGQARSLIVGDVGFSLSCKCNLTSGDKVSLDNDGLITLSLSGHINTDIGVVRLEEDADATPSPEQA